MEKRVLFVISRFLSGGIETALVEYLNGIAQLYPGLGLSLAIMTDSGEREAFIGRLPEKVSVHHLVDEPWLLKTLTMRQEKRIGPIGKMADEIALSPLRRMLIGRRLRRLQKEADFVVDFDSNARSFLDFGAKSRQVILFHFSFRELRKSSRRYVDRVAKGIERYDALVNICKTMADECVELYPSLSSKALWSYNPIGSARLKAMAAEKADLPFAEGTYAVSCMRLSECQKDLTTLIGAWALLHKRSAGTFRLLVLGDGPDRQQLQELIDSLGLHDEILLHGFTRNPYPFISHSRMFVHSSKFEGLSMAVVEAMILGKAVVCTDCPVGQRESLMGGEAGILTPIGDKEAMADAILHLWEDDNLRKQYEEAALKRATDFSPEKVLPHFVGDILGIQ